AVKKLTPMPVRFLIDTEPHPDHTTGHFVFSPSATIIAAAGAGESMRNRENQVPDRIAKLAATSPAMKTALEGYKFIPPQVEYSERMTLYVGERTFELRHMKGVHSESDTAIWLPKERVLFSASAFVSEQVNIFRPFVNISDILAAGKMMKSLNPEHVIPGHGPPTTTKLFDDGEKYYALLVERVTAKVKEGKSLDDIMKEVKMPEYASWASQDRMPTNIDAAYRMVTAKKQRRNYPPRLTGQKMPRPPMEPSKQPTRGETQSSKTLKFSGKQLAFALAIAGASDAIGAFATPLPPI